MTRQEKIFKIAEAYFPEVAQNGTLESLYNDSLDNFEVNVYQLEAALTAAYEAGRGKNPEMTGWVDKDMLSKVEVQVLTTVDGESLWQTARVFDTVKEASDFVDSLPEDYRSKRWVYKQK